LCERIIANTWRLRRVLVIEAEVIDKQREGPVTINYSIYGTTEPNKPKLKRRKKTLEKVTINKEIDIAVTK